MGTAVPEVTVFMASLRIGSGNDSDWVVANHGAWLSYLDGGLSGETAEAVGAVVKLLVKHTTLIAAHSSDSAATIPRILAKALGEPVQDICCRYALTDGVKPCT